jgi:glucose/arabinose dehydrogenase
LLFALALAACSDSDDKQDAGGGSEAGVSTPGGTDGGGGAGGAGGSVDGGGGDAGGGSMDAGGNRDAGGGTTAGRNDGGAAAGGGDGGAGGTAGNDGGAMAGPCDPNVAPTVGKLALETVVTGIDKLVYARQPPDSTDWWLVQQTGKILIHKASGGADATVLDVSSEITLTMGIGDDERGLLGLAFAPDFATSGLFYVMITPTKPMAAVNTDQIRQYKLTGSTATLQDTLLTVGASEVNHNGGTVMFGPDGMLYAAVGDGGGSCNAGAGKDGAPQDRAAMNGKILRLDPSRKAQMYAAEGNPFTENPLVWHYGLRNPFRISFDSANGDLYIGDVGQDSYEEVDFAKAGTKGLNFGWAAIEGKTAGTCSGRPLRPGDTATDPIFVADRRKVGCSGMYCDWISVIGGVVYRGPAMPALQGTYIFGDYKGVRMAALKVCDGKASPATPVLKNKNPNTPNAASFGADDFSALVAIVEDNEKEMYFVVNRNSLRKVVAAP